ncbi:UNVERIFIED_ORG: hypothetical protein ABIC97_004215 [Peribacillus simplex]
MTFLRNKFLDKNVFKYPKTSEMHNVTFVLFRATGL